MQRKAPKVRFANGMAELLHFSTVVTVRTIAYHLLISYEPMCKTYRNPAPSPQANFKWAGFVAVSTVGVNSNNDKLYIDLEKEHFLRSTPKISYAFFGSA